MGEFTRGPAQYDYLVSERDIMRNLLRDQPDPISLLNQNDKTMTRNNRQYLRPRHCEKYMDWYFQCFSDMGMPCSITLVSRYYFFVIINRYRSTWLFYQHQCIHALFQKKVYPCTNNTEKTGRDTHGHRNQLNQQNNKLHYLTICRRIGNNCICFKRNPSVYIGIFACRKQ